MIKNKIVPESRNYFMQLNKSKIIYSPDTTKKLSVYNVNCVYKKIINNNTSNNNIVKKEFRRNKKLESGRHKLFGAGKLKKNLTAGGSDVEELKKNFFFNNSKSSIDKQINF